MASYKLLIKSSAGKELAGIDSKAERQRIVATIEGLSADPRPHGSEKLAGHTDRYRIRQGNFRIVCLIDDNRNEATIYKIGKSERCVPLSRLTIRSSGPNSSFGSVDTLI